MSIGTRIIQKMILRVKRHTKAYAFWKVREKFESRIPVKSEQKFDILEIRNSAKQSYFWFLVPEFNLEIWNNRVQSEWNAH